MRVLFVTHSFPRYDGDAPGSFILRLAQALGREGVQVKVIAPSAAGLSRSDEIGGIPITRFRYAPESMETLAYTGTMAEDVAGSWGAKVALSSMLAWEISSTVCGVRAWHADLIHAHWWFPNGVAGATASRVMGIPLVTTSHGSDLRLLSGKPAAAPLARFVFRRSAAVTCVSSWLAEQAAPYTNHQPIVAPMPVDADIFVPGGPRDNSRILFVGRLSAQKGVEAAIRAVAAMRQPANLDIVGNGPMRDGLARLASELGITSRITWHAPMAQPQLADLYRRAAVLVVPSTEEGLGLVAVEAQLCETAVVAFASGGLADIVVNGKTGLLVPEGNVTALATALDDVIAHPELRMRLGGAGRQAALSRFTPGAAAAQYASIYRTVLEPNTTRSHAG